MKQITTNELQDKLSKIIKEVEAGEVYEVNRYSKSVAYLVSGKDFKKMIEGTECKECMQDLRKIAKTITKTDNR
jgi:prevent-host-death family protein